MNYNIDLSIVIISWKMKDLLRSCLESIYKFTEKVNFEIIVIDNNSQDGTSRMIRSEFSKVILIVNEENRGVAPARNQGIAIANGKYIVILDADVELIENSIAKLFEFMENNSDCGIAGSEFNQHRSSASIFL